MSDHLNKFNLKGKVALVTGALGLLGKEHCYALQSAGAFVVAADLCEEDKIKSFVQSELPEGLAVRVDVTDSKSVQSALEKVKARFGRCDILVNNAAINDHFDNPNTALEKSRFENYPVEMFQKIMTVNVTGIFNMAQVFGTEMAKQGSGSMINIASTYGIVAPDQSLYQNEKGEQVFNKSISYPASKGAVISMTKFLAAYWGAQGVRVNTLSPGGVENQQDTFFKKAYSKKTPLGRMAKPWDYRGALVFLASDASEYVTGANLVVDGGFTIW